MFVPWHEEILSLLEEDITDEVEMDCRLHSRLTGSKGRAMAGKVMYEHNVVLQLPEDNGANKITIIGQEECMEAAKLHLILEEQKLLVDHLEQQGIRKKRLSLGTPT